jgi:SAM-dependent methyltransferase
MIIKIILVLFIIHSIIRYIVYKNVIILKKINSDNNLVNFDFDIMYNKELKNNSSEILSDYNKINIESFKNGYTTCIVRKYIWSNINDINIDLSNIIDGYHILDAGCGTAFPAIYLCKKFPNVKITCIVNVEQLYLIAYNNIKNENLLNRIKIYLMDFDNLLEPVINQTFDRIFFIQSIGYSVDRKRLLNKCYSLLKNNGKIFIATLNFNDNTNKNDYNIINYIIKCWKYNFSTLNCIINDLKNEKFRKIKYVTINQRITNFFFLNLEDIYYIYKFNKENNTNILDTSFYFTPYNINNLIIASK